LTPGNALAEDLRRFGLILLAAGIVGGLLQEDVGTAAGVYASSIGVLLTIVGYWLHHREATS